MNKLVKILVAGKLSGVGYRFLVLQKAIELSITGFIKQTQNDQYTIEAEGTEENLKLFMRYCKNEIAPDKVTTFTYETAELKNHHNFTFGDYTVSDHYK